MSFEAMTWAIKLKLPCTEKMVLLMLADRVNKDTGRCTPSVATIADDCGLSVRTVRDAIRRLEDKYLIKTIRKKSDAAVNLPNSYSLEVGEMGTAGAAVVRQELPKGTAGAAVGVRQELPGGTAGAADKPVKQPVNITSKTTIEKNKQKMVLPDWLDPVVFDAFCEMRKRLKKPLSDFAVNLLIKNLDELRRKGHDPTAVLNQSILNSWQGVFPIKQDFSDANSNRNFNNQSRPDNSAAGRVRENVRRELESLG